MRGNVRTSGEDSDVWKSPYGTEEGDWVMLKKLLHSAVAVALVGATAMATITPAEAHRGGRAAGIVAGTIIGLGILGAAAAARDRDYCYPGHRRCEVVGQRCHYNRWGEYVCRDDVRCWRPRYCD
jgi:hypothetical protein